MIVICYQRLKKAELNSFIFLRTELIWKTVAEGRFVIDMLKVLADFAMMKHRLLS